MLPLFTVPVVTRAFGPELFGFVVTASAGASYVSLLVNFGFSWSGPRFVSRLKHDPEALAANVWSVMASQGLLSLVGCAIYIAWTIQLREGQALRLVQWVILATAMLNALVPAWLFQGLERMRDLVLPQLLARVAGTVAIVSLVRRPKDLLLYVSISAVASLAGSVMFLVLMRRVGVHFSRPKWNVMKIRIQESSALFLSNAAISFYTTANVLIVSWLLGNAAAGIFGLADRLRVAAVSAFVPMTQAIYPFVCRTVGSNDPQERLARRRMFQLMLGTAAAAGIAMIVAAPWAVAFLGGAKFSSATILVRIFSLVPLLVVITNILGVQTMLPRGMDRQLTIIVALSAGVGLLLQLVLTAYQGLPGSAAAYVLTEGFVCVAMILALKMHRPTTERHPRK